MNFHVCLRYFSTLYREEEEESTWMWFKMQREIFKTSKHCSLDFLKQFTEVEIGYLKKYCVHLMRNMIAVSKVIQS